MSKVLLRLVAFLGFKGAVTSKVCEIMTWDVSFGLNYKGWSIVCNILKSLFNFYLDVQRSPLI
jgi:hypothetical protein